MLQETFGSFHAPYLAPLLFYGSSRFVDYFPAKKTDNLSGKVACRLDRLDIDLDLNPPLDDQINHSFLGS